VLSSDTTSILVISGGVGAGLVGVGASVGVVVLNKDTQAFIGDNAVVDAGGHGNSGTPGVFDGTETGGTPPTGFGSATRHGVIVQAQSEEDITHIAVAAGAGFVGVSGAIDVSVISADTLAWIGAANINQTNGNAGADPSQGVYVGAADKADILTLAGAVAGGFVGVGGAINVGVLKNNINAQIRANANVTAAGDVQVNAMGIKKIDSYTFSGAVGAVGVAGSVSVWSVGDPLSSGYAGSSDGKNQDQHDDALSRPKADGSGKEGADTDAATQGQNAGGQVGGELGGLGSSGSSSSSMSDKRLGGIVNQGNTSLGNNAPQASQITGEENAANETLHGTGATIAATATITAGGGVQVVANENLKLNVPSGAVAGGLVGVGVSVNVTSVQSNVAATAGGVISASGPVNLHSTLTEEVDLLSVAGGGGFVGVGASVGVLNDSSTNQAKIGDGATIDGTSALSVQADTTQNVNGKTIGAAVGAVAVGASFVVVNVGGDGTNTGFTTAGIGQNANIGNNQTVGSVNVTATYNSGVDAQATGMAGGILGTTSANFAFANVDPTVGASIGSGSNVTASGDVTVDADAKPEAQANVIGVSVAVGAGLGISAASASTDVNVTASVGANATLSAGSLEVTAQLDLPAVPAPKNAYASAVAGGGGLLLGVQGAVASATTSGNVSASVGNNVFLPDGDVTVSGSSRFQSQADATGIGIGFIGIGIAVANATSNVATSASLGTGVNMDSSRTGVLTVKSQGDGFTIASSTAGSGGVIAGNGSVANSSDNSTASTSIGATGHTIYGSNITISSNNSSNYYQHSDSTNAAILGAAGAFASFDGNTSATTTLPSNLTIKATGVVEISSANNYFTITGGSVGEPTDNVDAAGGGGISATAAFSTTNMTGNSTVNIGNNLNISAINVPETDKASIGIDAGSKLLANDYIKLETGGAIDGAGVNSSLTGHIFNKVNIGTGANLYSTQNIGIGTYTIVVGHQETDSSTWGLAAVGFADTHLDVDTHETIQVGSNAQFLGLGNVNIRTGDASDNSYQTSLTGSTSAQSYVRGVIAVPDASASTHFSSNQTTTLSGAVIHSGRDTTIGANPHNPTATADGTGHGYELGFIPVTDGSSDPHIDTTANVSFTGTVVAGFYHELTLTIADLGDAANGFSDETAVSQNANSVPVSFHYDANFNPKDFIDAQPGGDATNNALLAQYLQSGTVGAMHLGDLFAAAGNVIIDAQGLSGSGLFEAHGGPTITVENHSKDYLVIEGTIVIPFSTGGHVVLTGGATLPGGISKSENDVDVGGLVTIHNGYGGTYGTPATGPGIIVAGEVSNLGGLVTLVNDQGSIIVTNAMYAGNISISAPNGAFAISFTGTAVLGAAPMSEWDNVINYPGGNPHTVVGGINVLDQSATTAIAYVANSEHPYDGMSEQQYMYSLLGNDGVGASGPSVSTPALIYLGDDIPIWSGTSDHDANAKQSPDGNAYLWQGDNDPNSWYPTIPSESLTVTRAAGDFTGATPSLTGDPKSGQWVNGKFVYTHPQSQIAVGTAVLISAGAVDLNTHIVVGPPTDWSVEMPSSLTVPVFGGLLHVSLPAYRDLWNAGLVANPIVSLPVNAINMGDAVITAKYDASTNQITMENVKAAGGAGIVRIKGALVNTNDLGNIQVNGGLGHVTVDNQTAIPLRVQNIYAGSAQAANASTSIVDLLDTNTNVQTMYTFRPGQGINVYTGTLSASMDDLRAGNPSHINGTTTQFDPQTGQRLEWQLQATLTRQINDPTGHPSASNWTFKTPDDPNNPWQFYNYSKGQYQSADLPDSQLYYDPSDTNQFDETITGSSDIGDEIGIDYFNYDGFVNNTQAANPQDNNKVEDASAHTYALIDHATLTLRMTVRADNPVGIIFAGHDRGLIDITSNATVLLDGTLTNPSGDTDITVTGGGSLVQSAQLSVAAAQSTPPLLTNNLTMTVDSAIGSSSDPISVSLTPAGVLNSTSGGGTYLAFGSSVILGNVVADPPTVYADVSIKATGSITGSGGTSITGRDISLITSVGTIGTGASPLVIAAHATPLADGGFSDGFVTADAPGDVNLRQVGGDLVVNSIRSDGGNVSVAAPDGGIFDERSETPAQVISDSDASALWARLRLTDSTLANDSVTAFEHQVDRNYQQYWSLLNNGTDVSDVLTLSASGITNLRPAAALALGISVPTDAQVQSYAQSLFTPLVKFFDANLDASWRTEADFTTFNPAFAYQATSNQTTQLSANSTWTLSQLRYFINRTALEPSTGTPVPPTDPNIFGNSDTLHASGSIGRLAAPESITIAELQSGTLTTEQAAALALASAPGDVTLVGQDGHGNTVRFFLPPQGTIPAGITLTGIEVKQTAPLFVAATGPFNATSDHGAVFVQSTQTDLVIGFVSAATDASIVAPQNIRSAGTSSPQIQTGGDLSLLAGTGYIAASASADGTTHSPLVVQIGGTLVSAGAGQLIDLQQATGDLRFERVAAGANAYLSVPGGSLLQQVGGVGITAHSLVINASGTIGTSSQYVTILLDHTGTLTADAGSTIWIDEASGGINPNGDMMVQHVHSATSDVNLQADGGIYNVTGNAGVASISGVNITLTAGLAGITGGIGAPDNFLRIDVNELDGLGAALGILDTFDTAAVLTKGTFVIEELRGSDTTDDLEVGTVTTRGDVTLTTQTGSIVDGRNGGTGTDAVNVTGNSVDLYAPGGNIGDPGGGNDLKIDAAHFAAGTIGVRATNNIDLTQTGGAAPVVLVQSLTGNVRFTVREGGSIGEDLDLLGSGAVLFIQNAVEMVVHGLINAIQGSILLRVADNVNTDPNAQILAAQNIDIYGDFSRAGELSSGMPVTDPADPGYGTVMQLHGTIAHGPNASGYLTRIFGNTDPDQFFFDQTFLGGTNPAILGGSTQVIPDGGGVLQTAYPGGKTRGYGSNTPTPAGQFAPAGGGSDFFVVNQLQTMNVAGGDTLTLDGQGSGDTYVVNTAGSQHGTNNYLINVLDTGGPGAAGNTLSVYGADSSQNGINSLTGQPYPVNNIFLTRRVSSIPGETANRPALYKDSPAFVAVLHTTLAGAEGSPISPGSSYVQAGSFPVERVNYDAALSRLMVFGQGGNNYFASDDVTVPTTLDAGKGNTTFQIGQIYGLRRDGSTALPPTLGSTLGGSLQPQDVFPQVPGGLTQEDVYGTIATTRGWLSAGNSAPLLAEGGGGDNTFIVYSNQAPLRLEGISGNNLFIVRAFALADTTNHDGTGEINWIDPVALLARPRLTGGFSTASQSDIRTGDGNNQVEYNLDAPVSVDGGNGFNKLVLLGTEFADHIVVTAQAIFGAGLSVSYSRIQVLEIDTLEGDDTIDVLSTAPGMAVRVIGGSGSNTINVAGDVAGDVVSTDLNGTSGTINQNIISNDPAYNGLVTNGLSTSVAGASQGQGAGSTAQGQVIIDQPKGFTAVAEGGYDDSYGIYLAQAPSMPVYVTVSAPLAPQSQIGNTGLLGAGDVVDSLGNEDTVLLSENPPVITAVDYDRHVVIGGVPVNIPKRSIVLVFDQNHWNKAGQPGAGEQIVNVHAVADAVPDADRVIAISHSVLSADPVFNHALVKNVLVTIHDNPVLTQVGSTPGLASADNQLTVLMGNATTAVTAQYKVQLAVAPATGKSVTIDIKPQDSQVWLDSADGRFSTTSAATANSPGAYQVTFTSTNWTTPVLVTVHARNIATPQDPHDTTIIQSIDPATTDPAYLAAAATSNQSLDVRVISDQTPGLFPSQSGGPTVVSAGNTSTGPGTGASYTTRLTKAPTTTVNVALETDGETDIVPGGRVTLQPIGQVNASQLFTGNVTISGTNIALASGSELGSFLASGFAAGQPIRIRGTGTADDADYTIAVVAADGKSMTLTAAAPVAVPFGSVTISRLSSNGVYTGQIAYNAAAFPVVLLHGNVQVSGTTVKLLSTGSFINANFAPGEQIQIGTLSGKFTIASVTDTTLMLTAAPGDGTYNGVDISKLLDTLVRTDGTSWLDSGFLEGELFEVTGNVAFAGKLFKIDSVTGTTANPLDELVLTDHSPLSPSATAMSPADLLPGSGTATLTVTQWAPVITFTGSDSATPNWYVPVTVGVVADPWFDLEPGRQEIKLFPKQPHLLSGIQGPLMVEGGPSGTDYSLRPALLLPGEANGPLFGIAGQPPAAQQINTLNIFDDGSVQNKTGTLTATGLSGLGMGSGVLDFTSLLHGKPAPFGEPGKYPLGISYGSINLDAGGNILPAAGRTTIQDLNIMLGSGDDNLTVTSTMVPGPFHNEDGSPGPISAHGGITTVHGGGSQLMQVSGPFDVDPGQIVRDDGLPWIADGFTVGQQVLVSLNGGTTGSYTVTGFGDKPGAAGSVLFLSGSQALTHQVAAPGVLSVTDNLQVTGAFNVPPSADRIVRTDGNPWQNIGFAIGQQVNITGLGNRTVMGFDNSSYGFGTALLVSGPLTPGPLTGTVAVASRNQVAGTFTLSNPSASVGDVTRTGGTWASAGFAVGQVVVIPGVSGNRTVVGFGNGGLDLLVSGGALPAGPVTGTVAIVRLGGNSIKVTGANAIVNQPNFTFDPAVVGTDPAGTTGRITRSDGVTWDSGGFTTGQQVSITVGGQSGQFVVTGTTNNGATLLVSGTGTGISFAHMAGVGATVDIDSPLVIYGSTSQDGLWYSGDPSKLSLHDFGPKPMQHQDNLAVTVSASGTTGTITRSDGNSWLAAGFVAEGLIAVGSSLSVTFAPNPLGDTITRTSGSWSTDGFTVGQTIVVSGTASNNRIFTIQKVTAFVLTLTAANKVTAEGPETATISGDVGMISKLTPSTLTLTDLKPGFAALLSGTHTIVQWNRLGNGSPDFIFPVANPFLYAGNNYIDASQLYANIPNGQLPPIGVTIYGGPGNNTILGSQAGDLIAGGGGNNTIFGDRGPNQIYGADGFNVNPITRDLQVVTTNASIYPDRDLLKAGNNLIYGDHPGAKQTDSYGDYDSIIFGAHGRVVQDVAGPRDTTVALPSLPQELQTTLRPRRIDSENMQDAGNNTIYGSGGDNILIGGSGSNAIQGGGAHDLIFGHNVALDRSTIAISSATWANGMATITTTGPHGFVSGESVTLSGMTLGGYNGTFVITVTGPTTFAFALAMSPGVGTAVGAVTHMGNFQSPRFQELSGTQIYSTALATAGQAQINGVQQLDPRGNPRWGDYIISLLETGVNAAAGTYGNDYIAGGTGGDNTIFGEMGNNVIQGAGSIDYISHLEKADGTLDMTTQGGRVGVVSVAPNVAGNPFRDANNALDLYPSITAPTDGNNYIEGGGGSNIIFGGGGQNDLIGGSSDLFSHPDPLVPANPVLAPLPFSNVRTQRQSGSNLIFAAGGTDIYRDDPGSNTSPQRHAQNATMMISNNGEIVRLVGINNHLGGDSSLGVGSFNGFLSFNYDNYTDALPLAQQLKIIARAATLLDYTPGGLPYTPTAAQAALDIGNISELHGETGDNFIFGEAGHNSSGMKGNVIFGGSGDDQIVGGYGDNWISGGSGTTTIIGSDGRIFVSRNGLSEPLNGVTAIPVASLNQEIFTPGHIQDAIINVSGQLKSTVDLEPFSQDTSWNASVPEWNFGSLAPHTSDDIIFAGIGNTTVHGGYGDAAISGGEALPVSYLQVPDANGNLAGIAESDWYHPYNPGNTLRFNPIDPSGTHPSKQIGKTGQFALYNEFEPFNRRKILLNADGTPYAGALPVPAGTTALPWFLDLNASETDGTKRLFGDLGNNWIVAGTGQNDLYGGFGNDLLDARSSQDIDNGLNDQPNNAALGTTNRAYGGAGKDVLIADQSSDRLIDWVGNFNTYIVPFAPWGMPTVSRTPQPALPQFLYNLSASDGADQTRAADVAGADPTRNGEPFGEMGLVTQHDAAWHDQTGAPSDQPPGNIGGSKRVVIKSGSLTGSVTSFFPDSGTWSSGSGGYTGSAAVGSDAISLLYLDQWQPSYLEFLGTVKLGGANKRTNGFLIFNYKSPTDFRYAGVDGTSNLLRIGHRTTSGWVDDATLSYKLNGNASQTFQVNLNGTTASLVIYGTTLSYTYTDALNLGMLGLGLNGTSDSFQSYTVQILPRVFTYQEAPAISSTGLAGYTVQSGTASVNSGATRYTLTPPSGDAALSTRGLNVASNSYVEYQATVNAAANGTWAGLVFDYASPNDYQFAAIVPGTNQVILGHRTPSGWYTDSVVTQTITAGTDYTLLVALDNTPTGGGPATVNVVLNGTTVLSQTFEYQMVGGLTQGNRQIGLFARNGAASFYNVQVRGDDPAYSGGGTPQLAAAPAPASAGPVTPLTSAQLAPVVAAAIERWSEVPGMSAAAVAVLRDAPIEIDTLPGLMLGQTIAGTIVIDPTAAGYGWFVDPTPLEDSEFNAPASAQGLQAGPSSPAYGRMDLLEVVMHELGHLVGQADQAHPAHASDLMNVLLTPGTRRLPADPVPVPSSGVGVAPVVSALPSGAALSAALPASGTQTAPRGPAGATPVPSHQLVGGSGGGPQPEPSGVARPPVLGTGAGIEMFLPTLAGPVAVLPPALQPSNGFAGAGGPVTGGNGVGPDQESALRQALRDTPGGSGPAGARPVVLADGVDGQGLSADGILDITCVELTDAPRNPPAS
jgi:hypothetical protein